MTIETRRERRKEGRLELPATAYVWLEGYELGPYAVDNLSVGGALLTGDMTASLGDLVQVLLVLPGEEALELDARVMRVDAKIGSTVQMGVAFEHWSASAEDALREALYGATSLADRDADRESLPPFFESDDPDFVKIIPPPR